MNLCRLIYRSVATAEMVSNQTLRDLEAKAFAANSEHGITGLLVLSGSVFFTGTRGRQPGYY